MSAKASSVDEAVPPSAPPPSNKKAPISEVLALAPSHADAAIAHVFRCMQTRTGADTILLFLCYASRLTGSVLEGVSLPLLRHQARKLVSLAYSLPPATTVILPSVQPPLTLRLAGYLKAFSGLLSETRTVGRLWGLLGLYFAAKRLYLKKKGEKNSEKSAESGFDTAVATAQIASLIVFQACENVAFLAAKKVLPVQPATQGRLMLVSVRAWGLYIAMEASRLLVERARKREAGTKVADDWGKKFFRNLSWAPLTVHWSTPGGFLPDIAVSLLAAYPAAGGMVDLWRETA